MTAPQRLVGAELVDAVGPVAAVLGFMRQHEAQAAAEDEQDDDYLYTEDEDEPDVDPATHCTHAVRLAWEEDADGNPTRETWGPCAHPLPCLEPGHVDLLGNLQASIDAARTARTTTPDPSAAGTPIPAAEVPPPAGPGDAAAAGPGIPVPGASRTPLVTEALDHYREWRSLGANDAQALGRVVRMVARFATDDEIAAVVRATVAANDAEVLS